MTRVNVGIDPSELCDQMLLDSHPTSQVGY